jgi:hypothetical protein
MLRDEALRLALEASGSAVLTIVASDRSMEPTLYGGDAVLAVPLEGDPVRGDILVFRQNDDLVVHRFLGPARAPDGAPCLRTRGDGRAELDPALFRANVRARVAALRRAGTWRTLEGAGPRLYAALVAWHDLAWAAAIHLSRPLGLSGVPAAADRSLLRLGTAVVLPLAHRRIDAPLPDVSGVSV